MARGKKNKPTDAPGLDALQKAVDSAAADVADLKDEIAHCEAEQAELRKQAQALPEGDPDRADLESKVQAIDEDGITQARQDLEQAEAKLAAAQADLAAAKAADEAPAAKGPTTAASPPTGTPPLRAGARCTVRWLLNGVGVLESKATIKTIRDAAAGIVDVTIEHRGLLVNLDGVKRATEGGEVPSWS